MSTPHFFWIAFTAATALGICVPVAIQLPSPTIEVGEDGTFSQVVAAQHMLSAQRPSAKQLATKLDEPASAPQLVIDRLEGITPDQAGAIFAPVLDRIERCAVTGAGLATFNMVSRDEHTQFDVLSAGSLDKLARRCVLQSLSLFDEDALTRARPGDELALASHYRGMSDASPEVRAQLTVGW